MLDHISLGVRDIVRSVEFYDAVLAPLRYVRLWSDAESAGYGVSGSDEPFAIRRDVTGSVSASASAKLHVAFHADNREAVVAFFQAAVALGATADGGPELHPAFGENYFAAFVIDPDGYRIEAVCHR